MALLFGGLLAFGRSGAALDAVADTILRNLSLLFVPAAVGVMQQAGLIAANWLAIFAALVDLDRARRSSSPSTPSARWRGWSRGARPMSEGGILRIWVYLAETPLLWLTATLAAFVVGDAVSAALGRHPLANPVVIAAGLLIVLLVAHRHQLRHLLRRRAVRALPARPGDGRARPAALAQPRRGARATCCRCARRSSPAR